MAEEKVCHACRVGIKGGDAIYCLKCSVLVSDKYNKSSTRLDVHTGTERVFMVLALVCWFAAFPFLPGGGSQSWVIPRILFLVSALLMVVRLFVDCTYILDNDKRMLLYSSSILGFTRISKICNFSDITKVGLWSVAQKHEVKSYFLYAVTLEIGDDVSISVSELDKDYDQVCCVAADLSRHLGAPFLPGEEGGGSLSPGLKSVPMEVIESRWGGFTPFVGVQAVDIIVLAITLLSAIHVLR